MKKIIFIIAVILTASCSKSDDDCKYDRQETIDKYETWLDNDNLGAEQRGLIEDEYAERLKEAC